MSSRILLLTWCAPDSPYAGGEVLRRLVRAMPAGLVRWVALARPEKAGNLEGLDWGGVSGRALHWRLRGGAIERWWQSVCEVPRLAVQVEAEARAFKPDVLWVLGELAAVEVGLRVAKRLGIPVHVTVHDAPEEARFSGISGLYGVRYARQLRALLRRAASVDVVSAELGRHLRDCGWIGDACQVVTLPPSVPGAWLASGDGPEVRTERFASGGAVRRIGLCGALRVGPAQWQRFVDGLGRLPFPVELVLFGGGAVPGGIAPGNVSFRREPYRVSEAELIAALRAGVDACYLGLWDEPERALFARTSLSSKLTTYAAAGLPVIVDGPEASVAWRLVGSAQAGVLGTASLERLFVDAGWWGLLAGNSLELCRSHFDLARNLGAFMEVLATACGRRGDGVSGVQSGRECAAVAGGVGGERGAGSKERRAESREQGARSGEQRNVM